ncbi:MAG: 3-keto-5-aminohexanoate cleavage protein [Candidatus Bathyarchaeia archaeon]
MSKGDPSLEKVFEGTEFAQRVSLQPKNPTMDKKICIVVCPTGSLFSRKQNPTQPYSPEEIAQEVIESFKEGACMVHLHCRDERGFTRSTPETIKKTLDLIFAECPDIISAPTIHSGLEPEKGFYALETVKPFVDSLLEYGERYIETAVFTPISFAMGPYVCKVTKEVARSTVGYLENKGIKPEFMGHNFEAIQNVYEWLIKPGIIEKPYFITMAPGMHHAAETYPDPVGLLYMINMKQVFPDDTVVGASIGGHNWLSLATLALLLGVDTVRVGKEDTMWLYPHKDEILRRNADAVKKIATIAKELGRDIATPEEARRILGIKR